MAKNMLPIIALGAAAFFLMKKSDDDGDDDGAENGNNGGATGATGTNGGATGATGTNGGATGATGTNGGATGATDVVEVVLVIVPGGPPINEGDPGSVADTSGPSGYEGLTVAEMMVIQTQLFQLGYDPTTLDGQWDYNTSIAVRDFQIDYELEGAGSPNPNTVESIDAAIKGTLDRPSSWDDGDDDASEPSGYKDVTVGGMKVIQTNLTQLGYDPGVIDGLWVYGGNTYDAVRSFQTVHGLQVDGKPGPNTQNMIDQVLAGSIQPDNPPVDPLPEPVPADDSNLLVIDTKLTEFASEYYEFKKPMTLVEQVRSTGIGQPDGFAYGYDIYQDQRTLTVDGRYVGIAMAKTNSKESFIRFYRGSSSSAIPSVSGRIDGLADKFEYVISVLRSDMT